MLLDRRFMTWQVEPRHERELSDADWVRYLSIVASYGGTEYVLGGFRRYRAAELCARTLRSTLGLETLIRLAEMPHSATLARQHPLGTLPSVAVECESAPLSVGG
jgi:hypothetical protein